MAFGNIFEIWQVTLIPYVVGVNQFYPLIYNLMSKTIILVGIGGLLGCISRYFTTLYFNKHITSTFPFGTFAANVLGCFIIGILYGMSERASGLSPEWRFFIGTGFCGGYTTFSAFAYENIKLLETSDYLTFGLYSVVTFTSGLLSVFLGIYLAKHF